MQHNGFKCLCVIYSWYVYNEQISRGPARLLRVHMRVSVTSNFLKSTLSVCQASSMFVSSNQLQTCTLSHLFILQFSLNLVFFFFFFKSIGGLLCMQENIIILPRLRRPVSGTAQYLAYVCGVASVVSSKVDGRVIVSPTVSCFQVTFPDASLCKH